MQPKPDAAAQLALSRCCCAGAARPQGPKDAKETFRSKVMRPLKDFGFGKHSFMEGGVGLFIFAGIGTQPGRNKVYKALVASRGCGSVSWLCPFTRQADVACLQRAVRQLLWSAGKVLRLPPRGEEGCWC